MHIFKIQILKSGNLAHKKEEEIVWQIILFFAKI